LKSDKSECPQKPNSGNDHTKSKRQFDDKPSPVFVISRALALLSEKQNRCQTSEEESTKDKLSGTD
jgi:hypothetical protein